VENTQASVKIADEPAVGQDGVLINPDALKDFSIKTYDPRAIAASLFAIPLNLFDQN
jgi:hypothetical protein